MEEGGRGAEDNNNMEITVSDDTSRETTSRRRCATPNHTGGGGRRIHVRRDVPETTETSENILFYDDEESISMDNGRMEAVLRDWRKVQEIGNGRMEEEEEEEEGNGSGNGSGSGGGSGGSGGLVSDSLMAPRYSAARARSNKRVSVPAVGWGWAV